MTHLRRPAAASEQEKGHTYRLDPSLDASVPEELTAIVSLEDVLVVKLGERDARILIEVRRISREAAGRCRASTAVSSRSPQVHFESWYQSNETIGVKQKSMGWFNPVGVEK
jgi:hypothetical protein